AGADKVIVNSGALERPRLITDIPSQYGAQCVVVSIDAARSETTPSGYCVAINNGRQSTPLDAIAWAREAVTHGAGEILVNSVSHDGDKRGYDLDLVRAITDAVDVPVVAMGGVGKWSDMVDGIRIGGADAVAAGNIFHYTEHSTKKAKEYLIEAGLPVRSTTFYKLKTPRRIRYKPF
ncbi:MAG: HisA/HisF-related TIM barrel protein, partial [Ferrovibrio sp.]